MRIGIDIRNIGKGRTGDEVVFFNLVKNLAKIDGENQYFLFTDITDTTLLYSNVVEPLEIADKKNFQIIPLKCPNKFIWNIWTLPKYLKANPADIYHTQYILPFFIPKKIKLITTIHDISFNFFPQFIKFQDLFFLRILIPWSLKRADKIIAVSRFTRDEIVRRYGTDPKKIEVAHNALGDNFAKREFSNGELDKAIKKYALPEKFILYVGTMQPRKNLPQLIAAYARIKNRLPQIKLVIAGKYGAHNFDKRVKSDIVKFGLEEDVLFTGYLEEIDKPSVFHLAHVFVFPSFYEGFGIPVLEAMSQGVPTLVSDIPSHREVANNAALFFKPEDLDDFSIKLYNISIDENLRKKLRESGYFRAQYFSWLKTAEKVLGIYKGF